MRAPLAKLLRPRVLSLPTVVVLLVGLHSAPATGGAPSAREQAVTLLKDALGAIESGNREKASALLKAAVVPLQVLLDRSPGPAGEEREALERLHKDLLAMSAAPPSDGLASRIREWLGLLDRSDTRAGPLLPSSTGILRFLHAQRDSGSGGRRSRHRSGPAAGQRELGGGRPPPEERARGYARLRVEVRDSREKLLWRDHEGPPARVRRERSRAPGLRRRRTPRHLPRDGLRAGPGSRARFRIATSCIATSGAGSS